MKGGQFAIFFTIVLSIWALMHTYVGWRFSSIPWIHQHAPKWALIAACIFLWALYPVARMLEEILPPAFAYALEFIASMWIGVMFLLVAAFLFVDVITLGGFLWRATIPWFRLGAAITALLLAIVAMVQGIRSPVLTEYELTVRDLPRERDGMVLVHLSDLHLGTLIGPSWLERIVGRVQALKPDIIVLVGDILDGRPGRIEPLLPMLGKFQAPFGVWGVTGNHEYYAGLETCVRQLERSGVKLLRDSSAQLAPGLTIAGVDDLTAREGQRLGTRPVEQALGAGSPGATIYLSHSPWHAETAATLGADLMLCGHTHAGQIWPFTYLVKLRYPNISGHYRVDGMQLIVGRGTGTWGPRMRLWQRSEIIRVQLRSPVAQ